MSTNRFLHQLISACLYSWVRTNVGKRVLLCATDGTSAVFGKVVVLRWRRGGVWRWLLNTNKRMFIKTQFLARQSNQCSDRNPDPKDFSGRLQTKYSKISQFQAIQKCFCLKPSVIKLVLNPKLRWIAQKYHRNAQLQFNRNYDNQFKYLWSFLRLRQQRHTCAKRKGQ